MRKTYDTMILGCGEAGVFAGYELIRRNPGMKVLIAVSYTHLTLPTTSRV